MQWVGWSLALSLGTGLGAIPAAFLAGFCSYPELDECFPKVWRAPMRCSWICCCWAFFPPSGSSKKQKIKYFKENILCEVAGILWERNSNCNKQKLVFTAGFFSLKYIFCQVCDISYSKENWKKMWWFFWGVFLCRFSFSFPLSFFFFERGMSLQLGEWTAVRRSFIRQWRKSWGVWGQWLNFLNFKIFLKASAGKKG